MLSENSLTHRVKNKSQKLIKCGNVWVGLYRQATGMPGSSKTIVPDVSPPNKPSKATAKSIPAPKALTVEKRKAEQVQGEQTSKKSRYGSTSLSTEAKQGVDTLQNIMKCKHREQDLKLQQAGQQSSKQAAESTTDVKDEEVSQQILGKGDLRVTPAKPPKPMGMVMHTKTLDVLQELHQQQLEKLKKHKMVMHTKTLDVLQELHQQQLEKLKNTEWLRFPLSWNHNLLKTSLMAIYLS